MAIKGFKEIVDNTGYKVDKKDREVFERALAKSAFGARIGNTYRHGKTDVIEIMLYDSSDNLLPQGENGELVRYIYLDDANIGEYFIINENERKLNDAPKFTINSERIIKDAGYTSGIFKTQVTLLNRRLGSEKNPYDKVWIHEISPSRTEMRVLPVKGPNNTILPDLQQRYNIYANGGQFRDDVMLGMSAFIESIDVQKVIENFLNVKGSVASGQGYINLIKSEFKIKSFDLMVNRIKTKFIEIMTNYASWKEWNIDSRVYGQPLPGEPPIGLSVKEIYDTSCDVIQKLIDKELPKRDLRQKAELSLEEQVTFDEVKKVLETVTKGNLYDSTIPDEIAAAKKPVRGCTNPDARNYNPDAEEDDGTCLVDIVDDSGGGNPPPPPPSDPEVISGCTDVNAINYRKNATVDDGTCKYSDIVGNPIPETVTQTWYCWCDSGFIRYTDIDGKVITTPNLSLNQSVTITFLKSTTPFFSCEFQLTPKKIVVIKTCSDTKALNYGQVGQCEYAGPPGGSGGGGKLSGYTTVVLDPTGIVYSDGDIVDDSIITYPPPNDVRANRIGIKAPTGGIK